jgi:hypothetical protein
LEKKKEQCENEISSLKSSGNDILQAMRGEINKEREDHENLKGIINECSTTQL